MSRKLALVLVLALLCLVPLPIHAAKDYYAEQFNVDATVEEGGSLLVTETVVFNFSGGPFTYVFRDLPTDFTDGVTGIAASMDGKPMSPGTEPGQFEVEGHNPVKVTWHFAPVSDSTHAFVLSYRMSGVVRQEPGADMLRWNALPTEHDYGIASSTVSVAYPATVPLLGTPEVRRGRADVQAAPGRVTFLAGNLRRNAMLQIGLRFPAGSLIATPPQWQLHALEVARSAPAFLCAALGLLAFGMLGLVGYSLRWRRDTHALPASLLRLTAPPDDLPPGIAGTIVGAGAQPAWPNALGTLFDLARRNALGIDELPERKWYQRYNFIIRLLDQPGDLRPHESGLLQILFDNKTGMATSVKLSDLGRRVTSRWKQYKRPLREEIRVAGMLDPEREGARKKLFIIAGGFIALAVGAGVVSIWLVARFGGWPFLIAGSLCLVGIAFIIGGSVLSPLSSKGFEQSKHWQSFYGYLRDVTRGREPAWDLRLFERYLPYAASFGLAEKWAKAFEQRGGTETPTWFHAVAASGRESMAAFVALTAASHSTGTGGATGAGGAAGGGASGAG